MNAALRSISCLIVAGLLLGACGDSGGPVGPDPDPDPDPSDVEELSGTVDGDLTLTSNVLYRVVGDVTVRNGATMTIEPGTRIEFESDTGLQVYSDGRLSAIGTVDAPIIFTGTSESPGWWDGIYFNDARHPDNVLDWVVIEYGGAGAWHSSTRPANLTVGRSSYQASVTVTNTALRHSGGFGLFLHANGAMPGSGDNTYASNASGPAELHASSAHFLDSGSSFEGDDPVRVLGNRVDGEVTWQAIEVPYRMAGATDVRERLTIDAGATFHFEAEGALTFGSGSVVRALGTSGAPIVFSGTQQQPGWWQGIYINQTTHPDNLMEHVVIEYAGGSAFHSSTSPANLTVARSSYEASVTLRNSILRHGAGLGMFLHARGELPGSASNAYTENADGPVGLYAGDAHFMDSGSSFTGNGEDYVWMIGNTVERDVTWQALDAPYGVRGTAQARNAELTIAPGANIAFDAEAGLVFGSGSTVRAVGTADSPIVFTGTQQQAGWWQGVWITQTTHPSNEMSHVVIEYGGNSAYHSSTQPANLTVARSSYDAALSLTHSTFRNSAGAGVFVHSRGSVNADICSANAFSGNAGADCTVN